MTATPEGVRAAVARAGREARQAAAAAERESRAALDRLRSRAPGERFAALEGGAPELLPEHRRELLTSLREQARLEVGRASVRAPARFASAWDVWRGRLPFQAGRLARGSLLALVALSAAALAYRRTPESWVELRDAGDASAVWAMPDGRAAGDRLVAGRSYALVRVVGDTAVLREWRAGAGYAEARVPVDRLQRRPDPAAR